ncbi:hypothetical protein [Arthronema virus TR020]|uniref:Uncharacterized protein n=1 Tax=Arthronema virus TR020 TaxID=2736280 RepID=A0A7G3WH08_9CAUD|nr:hypothetical protein [Arthronema virus TR020]
MSFYFSSIAPVLNSTLSYLASTAFKSHLFNAFILLLCLIAFYISLVIDIVCYCFALAVNCFYYILDCQPLPEVTEYEVDSTVYLPLPTPIAGLLMPAPDRVLVTPVTHEDRVLVTPSNELPADMMTIHTVVANKSVAFNLNGTHEYRALVCRDEVNNLPYLRWQYKYSKKYMPVRNATVAFGSSYDFIVRACYVALGI